LYIAKRTLNSVCFVFREMLGAKNDLPGEDRDENDLICTLEFGIWLGGIFSPFLL
jgi:hypothetical protein